MPSDRFERLIDVVSTWRIATFIALWVLALLVLTLIEKGVLAGWGDLFHTVTPHG